MRELSIAYGNSRNAKKWVNKTIKYDALKERLKTPIRTTESAEEYAKMSKTQRADAKDHGGFVGGVLKGGRRKADMVTSRSMIALDGDRIDRAFLESPGNVTPQVRIPLQDVIGKQLIAARVNANLEAAKQAADEFLQTQQQIQAQMQTSIQPDEPRKETTNDAESD